MSEDEIFQLLTNPEPDEAGLSSVDLSRRHMADLPLIAAMERAARTGYIRTIQRLSLRNCGEVTDAGVRAVAEHCPQLEILDLRNCKSVTDVGIQVAAKLCSQLQTLHLWGCKSVTDAGVRAIAECCPQLQTLHLWGCESVTDAGVRTIAEHCPQLLLLNLGHCKSVTDVSVRVSAEHCLQLQTLVLRNCKSVTDAGVRAVAEHCSKLRILDLGHCKLVTDAGVRVVAERCLELRTLDVGGIDGLRLPKELVEYSMNIEGIRSFYSRADRERKQPLNEAKMIVVGNEAVGKSALVRYLVKNQPASNSIKTEGVEIYDRINVSAWDVEARESGDNPLRLNVWDFGGQEVLYETHKLFLTARSLYLIVLEARRENSADAETVLHDWMRAIRIRGGEDVPVIVVVNKSESPHELRLDETRLRKDYPAIREIIRTSCSDPKTCPEGGKGIVELRKKIVEVIRRDIPHVRDWLPLSYFEVKQGIAQLAGKEYTLTIQQYTTLCAQTGIVDISEQDSLLTLLDRIGVVVRHSDTTLLDPNWLTTAIYRVLTHSDVVKAEGVFSRDDLGKLLKDIENARTKYPTERWKYIIDQTVACGLSFELPDQPCHFLMPEQLPPNEPELNWDKKGSLRFRYDYDSLPKGLLPRFIVEMHRYLTKNRTAWANGVVLAVGECKVLVRADRKDRRIFIFVTGPEAERRGALAVIREGFVKIHSKLFPDLKPKPMVPVDAPNAPDTAVEYDQLIESERQGIMLIAVKGATQPFIVTELLGGIGREPAVWQPDEFSDKRAAMRDVNQYNFGDGAVVNINNGTQNETNQRRDSHGNGSLPGKPEPTTPTATSTSIWHSLIGPGAAALVVGGISAMYLFDANPKWTALLTISAVVFAVVYVVQARHQWRSAHWPKPLMHLCVTGGILSAALPGLKLLWTADQLGRFEWLVDNSPWAVFAFLPLAGWFGWLQVRRERDGHHTS